MLQACLRDNAMWNWVMVAIGGAVGSVARYGLSGLTHRWFDGRYPVGTLAVNLVGCLLIGLLTPAMLNERFIRPELRVLILVGVLGGMTTFSTFGYETFALLNDGQWARAATNILANTAGGIALVLIGYRLSERLLGL